MRVTQFFFPGIWIMRQIHFATKLTLMALALLTPLLLVMVQLMAIQTRQMNLTRDELHGMTRVGVASELIRQLQNQRGQSHRVLTGTDTETAQAGSDRARETLRLAPRCAGSKTRVRQNSHESRRMDQPAQPH